MSGQAGRTGIEFETSPSIESVRTELDAAGGLITPERAVAAVRARLRSAA